VLKYSCTDTKIIPTSTITSILMSVLSVHDLTFVSKFYVKKTFILRNYWIFGPCPSSRDSKRLENTVFQEMDLFLCSGEWETPNLLGLLERTNFYHWTNTPSSEPFRICFYSYRFTQSHKSQF
jgi:hypothetical protein